MQWHSVPGEAESGEVCFIPVKGVSREWVVNRPGRSSVIQRNFENGFIPRLIDLHLVLT